MSICAPSPAKPAATCVSNTLLTSVAKRLRTSATSWRPACTTICDRGVGEHRSERGAVEILGERVDQLDPLGVCAPSGTASCTRHSSVR